MSKGYSARELGLRKARENRSPEQVARDSSALIKDAGFTSKPTPINLRNEISKSDADYIGEKYLNGWTAAVDKDGKLGLYHNGTNLGWVGLGGTITPAPQDAYKAAIERILSLAKQERGMDNWFRDHPNENPGG